VVVIGKVFSVQNIVHVLENVRELMNCAVDVYGQEFFYKCKVKNSCRQR
jgi:hypothetical protein